MEIKKIQRIPEIQQKFPPKNPEEPVLKKVRKQPDVQTSEADIVDISEEATEFLKKLEEEK